MQFTKVTRETLKMVSACFLGITLLTTTACHPQIFASSDSPDGKYRCEVFRVRPFLSGVFGDGEYRYYYFHLIERKPYQMLEGNGFEYGDGKIQLEKDKIEFKWAGDELTVINQDVSPARPIAVAHIARQQQQWKQIN